MLSEKPVFSVVCVYNNKKILDDCLLKSLERQDCPHETILIDNRDGVYSSAAAVLNKTIAKTSGCYVIFSHQDVSLGKSGALSEIYRMLQDHGELVMAGVAGKKQGSSTLTNITHGDPPVPAGKPISHAREVQTLDSCFFIVSRKLLDIVKFDENACPGWCLYAAEYCLSAGGMASATVLPVSGFYHRSKGRVSPDDFFLTLRRISVKHRESISCIYTTCGNWPTSSLFLDIKIARRSFSKRIKGSLKNFWGIGKS